MDYYRTNPYAGQYNPLMFHPSLAAFGLPSIPHIPHITHPSTLGSTPNPLLYGANPYFANPLLLREMLSQQSGLGATLHGGLTVPPLHMPQMLEQLQALQSMQLMAPGMLGAGLYPSNFQHLNNPYLLGVKDQLTSHPTRSNDAVKNSEASTEDSPKPRQPTPRFAKLPTPRTAIPRTALHSPQKSEPRKLPTDSYPVQIPVAADKNLHKKSPKDRTDRQTIKSSKQPISKQVKAEKKKMERKMADRPKQKHSNDVESTDIHPILKAHPNKQLRSQIQEARPRSPLAIPGLPVHGKPASYKNLTRERRLVANARERTRVHTISSAFEELRTQIPSYSCNQKLSKLAILRIACSYIRTLSVLSGRDETTTFGQGVDQCTRVLQAESRARSRRKTNKAQIEWEMTNYERHNQRDYHVTSTSGEDPLEISRDSSPQRTILDRLIESSSKSDDVTSDDDDVGQIDVTNMDVDVTNTSSDVLDDVTNKDHLTARKTKISENLNSNQPEPDVIL
uniref:Protein atonal homolog 8 n=1 Tax=Ciona savignyi TaxID=51511 RepID=H2YQM9_CIOSA